MTVTYSLEVSSTKLGLFAKLLFRWRGSIYRLMYREMILFTVVYYLIAVVYRYLLPEAFKRGFEDISMYCREFTDLIPITFVLGFYVAVVVGRWWQQYLAIPWPDRCCLQIAAYVQGTDERSRMIRRSLARYLNLMSVLTMQATSTVVRKRFPTLEHLSQAGVMTDQERIHLDNTVAPHGNWWIPAAWFCQLAIQARKENRIQDDLHLKSLIDDAMALRSCCGLMWSFDWISVPLVYTQVVTLAVYCFFAACLFGRQYLYKTPVGSERSYSVDYYVPVFTFFQFFFYMGWLKVAEELIGPYGEDDDDFELSWIVDRNIQVSYLAADGLYQNLPVLSRDAFWDNTEPELPYTTGAVNFKSDPFLGSTTLMNIQAKAMNWQLSRVPEQARQLRSGMASVRFNSTVAKKLAKQNEDQENIFYNSFRLANSRSSLASRVPSKTSLAESVNEENQSSDNVQLPPVTQPVPAISVHSLYSLDLPEEICRQPQFDFGLATERCDQTVEPDSCVQPDVELAIGHQLPDDQPDLQEMELLQMPASRSSDTSARGSSDLEPQKSNDSRTCLLTKLF